jgi:putative FmdB family regulatory protein
MTYEYLCRACGATWEAEQKITEEPQRKCPDCGAEAATRLISRNTFILNGQKWASKDGY